MQSKFEYIYLNIIYVDINIYEYIHEQPYTNVNMKSIHIF